VVADNLGIEVEDAVLVMIIGSLAGLVVLVRRPGELVIHAYRLSAVAAGPLSAAFCPSSKPWHR
jgi:hypothetical protein